MVSEKELKFYLEVLAKRYPKSVIKRLDRGSKVQKSLGLNYNIEDIDIDKKLGNFPEDVIPYGPIHRTLEPSQKRIGEIFNGSSEVPFQEPMEQE